MTRSTDDERQQTTLEGDAVNSDREPRLNDFGEPLGKFGVKSGSDIFLVASAYQKAVRRSNEELASWSAYELCRSGYGNYFWKRTSIISVEEIESGDSSLLEVQALEQMAKEKWDVGEWEGIVCAIRAAITLARAPKSREHVHANRVFTAMKNERMAAANENRDPEYDFPELGDECFDQHTQAGRSQGRGFKHFMVHSSRLTGETELGLKFKEFLMNNVEKAYPDKDIRQDQITEEDIETALTPVEPGEHDEPETVDSRLDEVS